MVADPPPPSPAAVVRAWSTALNANDNTAAGKLFAKNAQVVQGSMGVRLSTAQLAVAFNASLPCAGKIVRITVKGNTALATFILAHRPRHTCDGPGQKAAAVFLIKDGKIELWEQVAVPAPPEFGGPPA